MLGDFELNLSEEQLKITEKIHEKVNSFIIAKQLINNYKENIFLEKIENQVFLTIGKDVGFNIICGKEEIVFILSAHALKKINTNYSTNSTIDFFPNYPWSLEGPFYHKVSFVDYDKFIEFFGEFQEIL